MKYGRVYCCKRLRLLEALQNAGFEFYSVVPERDNPKYLNWLFYMTPQLEAWLRGYFAAKEKY